MDEYTDTKLGPSYCLMPFPIQKHTHTQLDRLGKNSFFLLNFKETNLPRIDNELNYDDGCMYVCIQMCLLCFRARKYWIFEPNNVNKRLRGVWHASIMIISLFVSFTSTITSTSLPATKNYTQIFIDLS